MSMPPDFVHDLVQNGAAMGTACLFLWYLARRDQGMQSALEQLAQAIHRLIGEDKK